MPLVILRIVVTLFLARLVISQLLTHQYSCRYVIDMCLASAHYSISFQRTCNVVNSSSKGPGGRYGLSSTCMPMSCDSSTTASLHGPSCVSSAGETLVCNNTVTSRLLDGAFSCNCEGAVSLTGFNNSRLDIDPIDLSEYQPINCSNNSELMLNAEGTCNFKEITNLYSYYDASWGGSSMSECLPLLYPPSNPETPYYFDGTPLICDNSVHISLSNKSYICKFGSNLDAETIQPLYSPTDTRQSPLLLDCMSVLNSHDAMVDVRQALDLVQKGRVDLRPIINIVPT
jgi:hypothetical protein